MYKKVLQEYKQEMLKHFNEGLKIESAFDDQEFIKDAYKSSIINMCIKYESLTAEMEEIVFKKEPRYNHPWANTRKLAEFLNIDISYEYKRTHDAWDLYNSLKHINSQTRIERTKMFERYNIDSYKQAAEFVKDSLVKLITKFEK